MVARSPRASFRLPSKSSGKIPDTHSVGSICDHDFGVFTVTGTVNLSGRVSRMQAIKKRVVLVETRRLLKGANDRYPSKLQASSPRGS